MPAPSIKSGMVPDPRVIAVIRVSAPAVAAIKADMVASARIEGSRVVGTSAARHIRALHIAAVSPRHDARSIALTHNRAPAANPVVNLHTVPVDRTDRPIRTDARRSTALQRNIPARR